ncbi:hypothetical protein T492DRAFT_1078062 [Pavlovales sp. CCMP2436]|nr:hypothetical protein T492DRAFT_1078062 [Pavlovales sp. CCMP2436]
MGVCNPSVARAKSSNTGTAHETRAFSRQPKATEPVSSIAPPPTNVERPRPSRLMPNPYTPTIRTQMHLCIHDDCIHAFVYS